MKGAGSILIPVKSDRNTEIWAARPEAVTVAARCRERR